jgi:DNA-binding PadR family transcriptional regulator
MAWLLTGPMHPYELGKRLKDTGKDRNIKYNRGSLYMVVGQLLKAGLIVEHETVRDSVRPERTLYALTEQGRQEVYAWMREWVATPQHEYPQFGVALSLLSVLSPKEAVRLLQVRSQALEAQIAAIKQELQDMTERGVQWIFLIEEDYRVALLRAESEFVGRLIGSLDQPEYAATWQAWQKTLGLPGQ